MAIVVLLGLLAACAPGQEQPPGAQSAKSDQDYNKGVAAYERGDYAAALAALRPLAVHGDPRAQNNLGFIYHRGHGVAQNYAGAVYWFRKSAEQGYAKGQSNLAAMYRKGEGVDQDHVEAVKWYRKAAEQGFDRAQYNLGVRYAKGQGVDQDYAEAAKWYRKAARQNHAGAKKELRALEKTLSAKAANGKGRDKDVKDVKDVKATGRAKAASDTGRAKVASDKGGAKVANGKGRAKVASDKGGAKVASDKGREKAAKTPPAPDARAFRVQFGSVKSKERAEKEAERLTRVHGAVLGGLKIVPVRADLGERGVYYRLRAGPLSDRAAANKLCRDFSALKQGCLVIHP